MKNILLCSPDFVRLNSNISDNVNSKVLATAIREVQEDELQEILGQLLFEKLQELVEDGSIEQEENANYLHLVRELGSVIEVNEEQPVNAYSY